MDLSVDDRLQLLFVKLYTASDLSIEDDTVLQKLQTLLQKHIQEKEDALMWCQGIGLITFISESLEENYVKNEKNQASVTLALHCLACLVTNEQYFLSFLQQEIMNYFKHVLSPLQENMTLHAKSLKVAESLLSHPSGIQWLIANNLWENLLISSLKSQNIFVQRTCVNVISTVLLKLEDPEIFRNCVRDLELVMSKFRETKIRLKEELQKDEDENSIVSAIARLRFNIETITLIIYRMLFETLGKRPLYSQLRQVLDLTSRILFNLNFKLSSASVIRYSKLLILSTLHRMQDKLKFGTMEQHHLDSINSDMLSLIRHMISKNYHTEFLVASFEIHKYWIALCKNIEQGRSTEVSKCESIIYVFLKLQVIPLVVLCKTSQCAESEENRIDFQENFLCWNANFIKKMVIIEEQTKGGNMSLVWERIFLNSLLVVLANVVKKKIIENIEMDRLTDILMEKYASDPRSLNDHCISHLANFTSIIDYLHPTSTSALLEIIILVLKFKLSAKPPLENNPRFYLNIMDLFRSLAERIECYELGSFLSSLCRVIWIPGITTRVKVSTLQTICTCLIKFVPPRTTKSRQIPANKSNEVDYIKLRETLLLCLSDVDWEVRDSALEFILTCISNEKKQGPPFNEWFLRFSLLDHILQAIGDAEPYVQATALAIISIIIPVHEIWTRLQSKNVKHLALRAVVRSGENCIKKSGLQVLQALVAQAKINGSERSRFAIPVVQAMTADPDNEIRLAALKVIRQILEADLAEMGMIDGEFPKVTFQCGKITNLQESEVENRVLCVIRGFCENGSFRCVVNCGDDNAKAVWMESNSLLKFIGTLVNKYNLTSRLSCLNEHKSPAEESPRFRESCRSEQGQFGNFEESLTRARETGEMEYVLQTSDLSVISKMKTSNSSASINWWVLENLEEILKEEEVPPCLDSVNAKEFSQGIEIAQNATLNSQVTRENQEREMILLLEDIFLAIRSSNEVNEARALDCY